MIKEEEKDDEDGNDIIQQIHSLHAPGSGFSNSIPINI